jgi:hypothetical protein
MEKILIRGPLEGALGQGLGAGKVEGEKGIFLENRRV